MEKIKLSIEGMVCGHCEVAIQEAVRRLEGVKKVKASRRKKEVSVEYDSAVLTQEQIVEAINATGYQVIL